MLAQADQARLREARPTDELRPIPASQLIKEPPRRDWMVEKCFTRGTVALVAGDGGIGKCLGAGTPVLMHDGSILPVEEVCEGDLLMGPDSSPRRVRGVTAGRGPLYRVTPVKGDPYVVNGNHVLSLKWTPRTNKIRPDGPVNISVADYLGLPTEERRHLMGWRTGVEWPSRAVPIAPYLLGLWLGDGTAGFPEITSANPEIVEPALAEFAEGTPLRLVCRDTGTQGKARAYRLSGIKHHPNALTVALRDLGIYREKEIPESYLINDSAARLELLAGLIDADGHLGSGCYEITQKSTKLAGQVAFLARSLGFAATVKITMKRSQHSELRPYNRVLISGDIERVPVKLPHKMAAPRQQKKRVLVTGITVEPIGAGWFYGFEVDGDHLFLLGDFTVTHNSLLMQQLLTSCCLGLPFLGLATKPGRGLFFACEDDTDELHRRQHDICRALDRALEDVIDGGLGLYGRVGYENTLARLDRKEWRMAATSLMTRLCERCLEEGVTYVVIDTATQSFAGNQNDEQQVVQFINMLRRLAVLIQGVVIVTKHPSLSGRALGTGESGNTAWSNSVRSRFYLHREKDKGLTWSARKSNYGPADMEIPLEWRRGSFVSLAVDNAPSGRWGYADA